MDGCLHAVSEYGEGSGALPIVPVQYWPVQYWPVRYWYEGCCLQGGRQLRLPRTELAETIARGLMRQLGDRREGKMYGVLLVEAPDGERWVLQAFSGLWDGQSTIDGWVPPIPGREELALDEQRVLEVLEAMKQELIALQQIPERQRYYAISQMFRDRLQVQLLQHQQRKLERHQQRQWLVEQLSSHSNNQPSDQLSGDALAIALEELNDQSRRDGLERRKLKQERDRALGSLKLVVERADERICELKQQRKQLSRQLQEQMQATYWLTNFAGESRSLQHLMPDGAMPTGTGDCCAPKLLHYAATHHLKPLAMAEFWWGPRSIDGTKVQGEFYGACAERCQPLMGFLLSGLPRRSCGAVAIEPLEILYEDEWLIAVDKPAGLLSVPGRASDRQDSVLSRVRGVLPEGETLLAVHRLDQDTSGVLLLARDRHTYRHLSQQFAQRQVSKVYEALLAGQICQDAGVIDLPLGSDWNDRPRQKVDYESGKPSLTHFRVIDRDNSQTRVEFYPLTGRTHQLRIHALVGLGVAIWGDRLYGCAADRLYLHARELTVHHPHTGQRLQVRSQPPF